jgi:anaerobic selenocysteine-containing dehydrogenase
VRRHDAPQTVEGTWLDTALALGLMHVLVKEDLHDADYVERHTVGFDALRARLAEYPPRTVASITGVKADDVVELARAYATTRPAAIQVHIGREKHRHGGMTYRSIACLPALVGAWHEPGGGLLYSNTEFFRQLARRLGPGCGSTPTMPPAATRVYNGRGVATLTAEVTEDVQRDCGIMLHGWWASRIGGSSANALTHDDLSDLGRGSALHDTWVEVEKQA